MAEEKVGFTFEWGLRGERQVERSLDTVIAQMIKGRSAADVLGVAFSKFSRIFEVGLPVAIGLGAMAEFLNKAHEVGEQIERNRFDIERLTATPVTGLNDADLASNLTGIVDQFKALGIEAGHQFGTNFWQQVAQGAYNLNWNFQAYVGNMFGANIGTAESLSPEAATARNRLASDLTEQSKRQKEQNDFTDALSAIGRASQKQQADLLERHWMGYDGKGSGQYRGSHIHQSGVPNGADNMHTLLGVDPNSYAGRKRAFDIRYGQASGSESLYSSQGQQLQDRLAKLRSAPIEPVPGTDVPNIAKRAKDIGDLQERIAEAAQKELAARIEAAQVDQDRLNLERERVRNQNWGHLRDLGLGGHSPGDVVRGAPNRQSGRFDHGDYGTGYGTLEGVNVLKEINKNIIDAGAPTILN